METFSTELFTISLALIGGVVVISALLSGLLERSGFPQVAVLLGLGAVLGPAGLDLLHIELDSPSLRVLATLSLALVLFTDALGLSLREVREQRGLATLLLGPGTLASAALFAALAHWLLGLSVPLAAITGAALASTDPVLLRGLLRRADLAASARVGLRLESGLNDIVLLPVVLLAMAWIAAETPEHAVSSARLALDLLVLSPGAGVAVGVFSIAALDLVRRRVGMRRDYESLYSLGVAFTAFAAAESVHGSGFIAAFAAGATIAAFDVQLCDCFKEYGETTSELALLFTFVLLGGSLIWRGVAEPSVPMLAFALLVLFGRPAIYTLALRATAIDRTSRNWIAWFGPRGLSSILLVLLPVFAGIEGADAAFAPVALVVLLSVALHGGALMWRGERGETSAITAASAAPEVLITPARVDEIRAAGSAVQLLDARLPVAYQLSTDRLAGDARIRPDMAVFDVGRLSLPGSTWLIAYCTCPEDATAVRVAGDLQRAGYPNARALAGGFDAAVAAGWPRQDKVSEVEPAARP